MGVPTVTANIIVRRDIRFHGFPLKITGILKQWIVKVKRDRFKPTVYSCLELEEDAFKYQPFTGELEKDTIDVGLEIMFMSN